MAKMTRAQFLKMIAQRKAQKKGKKDRLTPGDTTDAPFQKYGNARFSKLKGRARA